MMKTLTLAFALLLATVLAPVPVRAQAPLTICTGTDTTTYNPGVKLFPRTIDTAWTDDYPICLSTTPGIVGASSPGGAYTSPLSCLDLLTSDPVGGSQRVDWSNGQYSIFSWDALDSTIVSAGGQSTIVVNATITEGLFLGQPLIEIIVLPEPNLAQCLIGPGITETTGSITLMVLPL
jgi:hypothetical protein